MYINDDYTEALVNSLIEINKQNTQLIHDAECWMKEKDDMIREKDVMITNLQGVIQRMENEKKREALNDVRKPNMSWDYFSNTLIGLMAELGACNVPFWDEKDSAFRHKVNAIKTVREMAVCGLKEAKNLVEFLTNNYNISHKVKVPVYNPPTKIE